MNDWLSMYLGRGALPRDLSAFEIEAFFTYSEPERRVIDDERRTPSLKLALALQIGFLRMTGRLLEALRVVPPALWRHLGTQFGIEPPDLASLRTMYRRRRTLFEQQDLACAVLGFHSVTEAQRRALVRAINAELARTSDRQRLVQFARRWLYDHKQIIPRERELRTYIAKAIRQHEAMLARGVGLDLCPRLKELSDRHLFLPRGSEIPENLKGICHATLDPAKAARQWDPMVHLFASVYSGHSSAITVLARYGSAARGDPLYEAMVQVGKLLRTVFLCDYFVIEAFRRELLRVLNRGEAVNALKRSIYVGRVASYQAKQHEEMQAVADALSLLANLVMAWNTMKMQSVLDRWNARRSTAVPLELIGRIAPTRTEGINLRGVFTFPIEQYQAQLLPSLPAAKSRAFAG